MMSHGCVHYDAIGDIIRSISIFLMVIPFVIVSLMLLNTLIVFYCPYYCNKKSYHRPTFYYQLTSITSYLLGIGCIACDTTHVLLSWRMSECLLSDTFIPLRVASNTLSFNAYIFTDLVILGRLYYTFKYSIYKLSNYLFSFLIFLLFIIICCDIIYILSFRPPLNRHHDLSQYSLLTFLMLESILSFLMAFLFSNKLHQVVRPTSDFEQETKVKEYSKSVKSSYIASYQTEYSHTAFSQTYPNNSITNTNTGLPLFSIDNNNNNNNNNDDRNGIGNGNGNGNDDFIPIHNSFLNEFELNIQQKDLVNLCTKHVVITSIASIYFFIRFSYRQVAFSIDQNYNTDLIWMSAYLSRTYVFVTNGIAVYFGFVFSSKWYYKLFGKCHICVFQCCSKRAKKEIIENAMSKIVRQYSHSNKSKPSIELKMDNVNTCDENNNGLGTIYDSITITTESS